MGRAARWLRGLLGGKKSAEEEEKTHSSTSKEKRRWGFGKSFREKEKDKRAPPPPPYYSSSSAARGNEDEDQNKRAIAVAAATAAVAEAAVAAAQAAAAVVRLTSSSGRSGAAAAAGKRYESAAVKIQSAFRAYLARRALRALRGLVKLQALVRGNIVRKQAAETLRCMQALVRVQARTRACRALRADRNHRSKSPGGPHPGPPTPDKYEQAIRSKAMNSNLKKNSSKAASTTRGHDQEQAQSSGWNWLDRWMEERYWDSRESNQSGVVATSATLDDEKNAKILEVDTGKPNVRRKSSCHHSSSAAASDQNSRSFNTMPDSPSKDSTVAQRSIPSPSSVGMQSLSPLRFPVVDGGEYCESPQFFSAMSRPGSSRRGPFTPAKSDCSRSLFSAFSDYPSYMANTESSRAKVRSHSAPKQRPEFEKLGSVRRGSGHGLPQPSVGSTQKSSSLQSKFANKAYPGSGRLDRLGMPVRI